MELKTWEQAVEPGDTASRFVEWLSSEGFDDAATRLNAKGGE